MAEIPATAALTDRGTLDGHQDRLEKISGTVSVEVLPLAHELNLRIDARFGAASAAERVLGASLPGPLSWTTTPAGATVAWLGPDEWLVIDSSRSPRLETELRAAIRDGGAVVDQSGQRISMLLAGDARGLLVKGTGLDLRPERFGRGTALQGILAEAVVILLSRSDDASRIELLVRTSFARHVAGWLLDAAHDPLAYPAGPFTDHGGLM